MKLTFSLSSANGAVISVIQIMQKPQGLVAVGEVTSGSVSKGDTVGIQNGDKVAIYDKLKRIEIDHEEVLMAESGQLIGVCLTDTSKEGLLRYLGRN